jgi:hypothetical protein
MLNRTLVIESLGNLRLLLIPPSVFKAEAFLKTVGRSWRPLIIMANTVR